jgi:cytochrome c-type biogenesis protein
VNPVLLAPLALTAGVLSFTSPCSLPLVPGYLAYMSALPEGGEAGRRVRVRAAARFVAGFATVFTALGTAVGVAGGTVARHVPQLGRLSGAVLVVAGLLTAGLLRRPAALQRERRPGLQRARRGPGGAFVLGAAFAAGWSPCIGPVLASILAVGARTQTAAWGAALLLLYSLGLGIPFVLLAAGTERVRWLPAVRRHAPGLERAGGAILTVVGVLLLTGSWERLLQPVQRALTDLEWPPV